MDKFFRVQVDCFSQPIEYKTTEARLRNLYELCNKLQNLDLLNIPDHLTYADIVSLVSAGALSIRSASYFLSGRTTVKQNEFLLNFFGFCLSKVGLSMSKVFELWQKQENVVPENTFLFPLAELASKDEDFSSDVERYKDTNLLDLKEI